MTPDPGRAGTGDWSNGAATKGGCGHETNDDYAKPNYDNHRFYDGAAQADSAIAGARGVRQAAEGMRPSGEAHPRIRAGVLGQGAHRRRRGGDAGARRQIPSEVAPPQPGSGSTSDAARGDAHRGCGAYCCGVRGTAARSSALAVHTSNIPGCSCVSSTQERRRDWRKKTTARTETASAQGAGR